MRKTTFQRVTMKRILEAAPDLKYVAFYHREEECLNACMMNYEKRSFVYVMTSMYEGKEYYLYVGKSKAQYARNLTHSKKFEYDFIYLYECEPEQLGNCERAVIKALAPLFNRSHNPKLEQYKLQHLQCIDIMQHRVACYHLVGIQKAGIGAKVKMLCALFHN